MTHQEIKQLSKSIENPLYKNIIGELARRELARRSIYHFVTYTMDDFESTWYHRTYYKILDAFCSGQIKKLIISAPPQTGKSEGSSRRLPAYILGKNPDAKIGLASYASNFAQQFSVEIQRIINDQPYFNLFPNTLLATSDFTEKANRNYKKTQGYFEVVDCKGSLKTVGRCGGLTGSKIDYMILDDLYKDYSEGNSPIVLDAVIDWYTSVVLKRLHNDSQELIVFTRWNERDLVGWIEKKQKVKILTCWDDLEYFKFNPDVWAKINFQTLKVGPPTELDPREPGEALWPERHSKENKESERKLDEEKFDSLEQGDPRPKAGMLYSKGFKTYTFLPELKAIKNATDSADEGTDYLCSICYGIGVDNFLYVLDILYTQEPHEITEGLVADMLKINRVREADFESNNGGKGFARAVDRILRQRVLINWFPQRGNKESRILTNAPTVMAKVLFPINWTEKWPEFARDILRFKKNFKSNDHDDCADNVTMVVEHSGILDIEDSDALYRK